MKVRDSGMPPHNYWETLFDVPAILDAFGFGPQTGAVAELGCGYGTFTLPLARRVGGAVHAFDIERDMVAFTEQRVAAAGVDNVRVEIRDVLANGFGPGAGALLLGNWIFRGLGREGVWGRDGGKTKAAPLVPHTEKAAFSS